MRKFKQIAIYGGLLISGGLASFGVNKLGSKENVESTTEYTTEFTVNTVEAAGVENYNDQNYEIEEKVSSIYNEYQTYFDTMGYTEDNIRTTILSMAGMTDDLTKDDITDSCRMINDMFMSDNLLQKIDNIDNNSDVDCELIDLPKVSEFILEKDNKILPIVQRVENDRDLIINSIKETGDYKSALDQFNNDVVDMSFDTWNEDEGLDTTNLSNEGSLFIVSSAKYNMLALAEAINPGKEYIEGNKIDTITNEPQKVKIRYNEKEQDIENQVMQADLLGLEVSSDIVDEYAKIRSTKKIVQFETEMCNYQHSLETKVEELSNSYSYNLN